LHAKAALSCRNNKAVAALSPCAIVRGNAGVPGPVAYNPGIVDSPLCRSGLVISGFFLPVKKPRFSRMCFALGCFLIAAAQLVVVTAGQDGLSLKNTDNFSLKIDFPLPDG
jgi:hypothetical protein